MGPYMSSPNQEKHTTTGSNTSKIIEWAASEMQGWRNSMEDAHIHKTDVDEHGTCIFGVFDGHGGQQVAKFVQRHFVEEFLSNQNYKSGQIPLALEETFLRMDELIDTPAGKKELYQIKNDAKSTSGVEHSDYTCYAGCTANVAVIYKNTIYVSNAGDSRSILSVDGKEYAMSEDHKPDNPIEKKRIVDGGGYITEGRVNGNLNLSRAMGDMEYKHDTSRSPKEQLITSFPDVKAYPIDSSVEFILMGCDGIWECLTNQELVDKVKDYKKQGKSSSQIVEQLLDDLVAPDTSNGVGCDNMTTLLINFKN